MLRYLSEDVSDYQFLVGVATVRYFRLAILLYAVEVTCLCIITDFVGYVYSHVSCSVYHVPVMQFNTLKS